MGSSPFNGFKMLVGLDLFFQGKQAILMNYLKIYLILRKVNPLKYTIGYKKDENIFSKQ